jgi:inositol phosphorylceramide mannosyltransferase catalytic subunit
MPEPFRRYGDTWRHHHPDWEMKLWTDDELPPLSYPDSFARGRNHSERSDVLRYELLRQFGGIYVDTDLECLRPVDPLLKGVTAFAAHYRAGRVGTSIMGSIPHHPVFERAVEGVRERVGRGRYPASTGPALLTEILADFPDVTIFGPETFYPYRWNERHRAHEAFPDAYAVHHWAVSGRELYTPTPAHLTAEVERLRAKLAAAERQLQRRQLRLAAIENSAWWRLRGRLVKPAQFLKRPLGGSRSQR